jgi:flagellar basal body P-ring formation protein FlgA
MWRLILALLAASPPALADSVVTTRAIPARTTVSADDVTTVPMYIPGAIAQLDQVIGQTTAAEIAAGRAVLPAALAPRMQVERNAPVVLVVQTLGMEIRTEGRTLSAGYTGQTIDIMNLSSRARLRGTLRDDGTILVTLAP